MKPGELHCTNDIVKLINAGHLREVRQPHDSFGRPLSLCLYEQSMCLGLYAGFLLVQVRGEEPKLFVLELKRVPFLGDAAFAQDDRLPALGERLADDGPFLESVLEHGYFSLFGSRVIRSVTAAAGSLPS